MRGLKPPKPLPNRKFTVRKTPLWDLDRDGTTQSLLSSWEQCQEQTALSWIDGITPKALSTGLEFGSIMHYCLEHQFSFDTPEECAAEVCKQYEQHRMPSLRHTNERDQLRMLCGLAEVTFPRYVRFWGEDDARINWISREEQFDIPYDLPLENGGTRTIRLRGMRDGIYRIAKGKKFGVFETKNKSVIKERQIHQSLKADMQTLFYIFATYLQYGECPKEITYNVIKRSSIYRRKNESWVEYVNRAAKDIDKKTDYDKRTSEYFLRWEVTLVEKDIVDFVDKTLNPLLRRFCRWWDEVKKNPMRNERFESPYHSQSLNALENKYGMSHYFDLIVSGLTTPYFTRSAVFPELEDSFLVIP